jgi:MinD superfamily P-loop ATPase
VVTEPTLSGLSDLKRTISLLKHFRLSGGVLINKFDINLQVATEIENVVKRESVDFLGKLPFNPDIATTSMEKGLSVIECYPESNFAKQIKTIAIQLFKE